MISIALLLFISGINAHSIEAPQILPYSDSFYQGCGVKNLCFGVIDGCVSSEDCKAVVAITVTGDRYEFELKAVDSPSWVGVGLSDDTQMGNDSVIECVKESSGTVKAYLSWTTPRPNLNAVRIPTPQQGIQLLNSSAIDDTLYCHVLRDVKTIINEKEFDLENTKYHILVAAGTTTKENGIGYHDIGRLAKVNSTYLSDVKGGSGASTIFASSIVLYHIIAFLGYMVGSRG